MFDYLPKDVQTLFNALDQRLDELKSSSVVAVIEIARRDIRAVVLRSTTDDKVALEAFCHYGLAELLLKRFPESKHSHLQVLVTNGFNAIATCPRIKGSVKVLVVERRIFLLASSDAKDDNTIQQAYKLACQIVGFTVSDEQIRATSLLSIAELLLLTTFRSVAGVKLGQQLITRYLNSNIQPKAKQGSFEYYLGCSYYQGDGNSQPTAADKAKGVGHLKHAVNFNDLADDEPTHCFIILGEDAAQTGKPEQAAKYYYRALKLNPPNIMRVDIHKRLGDLYANNYENTTENIRLAVGHYEKGATLTKVDKLKFKLYGLVLKYLCKDSVLQNDTAWISKVCEIIIKLDTSMRVDMPELHPDGIMAAHLYLGKLSLKPQNGTKPDLIKARKHFSAILLFSNHKNMVPELMGEAHYYLGAVLAASSYTAEQHKLARAHLQQSIRLLITSHNAVRCIAALNSLDSQQQTKKTEARNAQPILPQPTKPSKKLRGKNKNRDRSNQVSTTPDEWQLEAQKSIALNKAARKVTQLLLNQKANLSGEERAECYMTIAEANKARGLYPRAEKNYLTALKQTGISKQTVVDIYYALATLFSEDPAYPTTEQYNKAIDYYRLAACAEECLLQKIDILAVTLGLLTLEQNQSSCDARITLAVCQEMIALDRKIHAVNKKFGTTYLARAHLVAGELFFKSAPGIEADPKRATEHFASVASLEHSDRSVDSALLAEAKDNLQVLQA